MSIRVTRRGFVALLAKAAIVLAGTAVAANLPKNRAALSMTQKGDLGPALSVNGLVQQPLALTLDNLKAMPSSDVNATLYCVGSTNYAVAEGNWKGVKLSHLLQMAGVSTAATKIAFQAIDGFTTDLDLATGKADDIIVAFEKDGGQVEGGLHLVAPGLWGYKWIKGLSSITLVDYNFLGLYEKLGYPDLGLFGSLLYVNTDFPSVPFSVDKNSFTTGLDGSTLLTLENGSHDISFPQNVAPSEGVRLQFLQWGDGSFSPARTFDLSSNTTLSVDYGIQYLQTVNVAPSGSGTTDPSGSVWHNVGDVVGIKAFPSPGFDFAGWSGDLNGTANPIQVMIDGPKYVTANFQGQPVPEFPGALPFFTILVGTFLALLAERRMKS